jgi:alkylation response protein AidB-like acyl-CoA dehydrogenase
MNLPHPEAPPAAAPPPLGPPTYEALADRFRPLFRRIADGAVQREAARELPFEAVEWLRAAGFGAVRIPRSHGGLGATLPQLFRLLVELGEADSNVSHLLRGHFAFLEDRLNRRDPASHDFWFPKVSDGALIGYAMAERIEATDNTTTLKQDGDHWVLSGEKYYSTGTLYADWIVVSAVDGEDFVGVALPATAPGVTREDDWDGFGQRLTGSGTTRFDQVRIPPERIIRRFSPGELRESTYHLAFLQLILLATLAGIGRAVLRDGVGFVQRKTRAFGVPGKSTPASDPLVQRVIGRLSALSFSAETIVDGIARALEEVHQLNLAGGAEPADFTAVIIKAFQAQQIVISQVLEATTLLFEVGGASATSESKRLDRHWRNARTVSSHNPAIYRERAIGDYLLNGTVPEAGWAALRRKYAEEKAAAEREVAGVGTGD